MVNVSYTVRESDRAKHVSLKISPTGNLEVVVPVGFNHAHIPDIVQKKRRWIERVQHRIEQQRATVGIAAVAALPKTIDLRAIAQQWQVQYTPTDWSGIKLSERSAQTLELSGQVDQVTACQQVLRQWLMQKAKRYLPPWLHRVSRDIQLPFERVTVRHQKTRWASCSSKKSINVNGKLLFLPPELVRYVFIHELCHTIHLNHSPAFWQLVGTYEPDYQHLDDSLRDVRYWVPLWMEQH